MKEKFAWLEKQKGRLWFAVLLNAVIFASLMIIFWPSYETNDDIGLALFVNGARGAYDAHFIYSNYVLGCILAGLYRVSDAVPWYAVLQYFVLFSSFTVIAHVTLKRLNNACALWLSVTVLYFFAYDGYISVQFTKTAGIATAAGVLLLFYALDENRIRLRALIAGYVLACIGFMYRNQQFLAVFALMSGIGIFWLLECLKKREHLKRRLLCCFAVFAGCIVLAAGLSLADRYAYRSQEWQDYFEYNELLTELMDYGFPDYVQNEEAYQELGIDRIAYRLYRGWSYTDTEKFTAEVMRRLVALKPPRKMSLQVVKNFLLEVPRKLFSRYCFCCFLLVLGCWILWGKHNGISLAAVLYEILLLGIIYLYLYYTGRYLYNRVDVGLWLAAVLLLLWSFRRGETDFSNKTGIAVALCALVLTQSMWRSTWRIFAEPKAQSMQTMRSALTDFSNDQEHLYFVRNGVSYSKCFDVFDTMPYGCARNVLTLGGWQTLSPWYFDTMDAYGVKNPYRDMAASGKVYLVDTDPEDVVEYIRQYYDASVQANVVTDYGDFAVYQIAPGTAED